MPHFPFTELHHDILGPPMGVMKTFVMALAFRLRLSTAELVMAYAFVERALVANPSLMRIYSVRPMFLGGCVLATKLTRDYDFRMHKIYERIDDVLNTMDIRLLVRVPLRRSPRTSPPLASAHVPSALLRACAQVNIEHQMLECLHWRFPCASPASL